MKKILKILKEASITKHIQDNAFRGVFVEFCGQTEQLLQFGLVCYGGVGGENGWNVGFSVGDVVGVGVMQCVAALPREVRHCITCMRYSTALISAI